MVRKGFAYVPINRGIEVVSSDYGAVIEFDGLYVFKHYALIIEVKSGGLNGFSKKVSTSLFYGREIFGAVTHLLIFYPFPAETGKTRRKLERNRFVHCGNLRIPSWAYREISETAALESHCYK